MKIFSILSSFLMLGLSAVLNAQVQVSLQMERNSYLVGESIPVQITLTNLTGKDIDFEGTNERPWLDFMVRANNLGVPVKPARKPLFGKVTVPAGEAVSRRINLAEIYAFTELGNFSIYAIVRLPHQTEKGFQSNRRLFTVSTSPPQWSKKVGVPGTEKTHEYRLIQFTDGQNAYLYAQVADDKSGHPIRTYQLGNYLAFRKPLTDVDQALNMHVLYMVNPQFWRHVSISPTGKFLGQKLYRPTPEAHPRLVKNDAGDVFVNGGIYYDPDKAAEERKGERKASDRPDFIYE